jgi:hypothetical protein
MIENLIEFTDPILQIEGLPPVEARKLYKNRLRCHFLPVKTFLPFCKPHVIISGLCHKKMNEKKHDHDEHEGDGAAEDTSKKELIIDPLITKSTK